MIKLPPLPEDTYWLLAAAISAENSCNTGVRSIAPAKCAPVKPTATMMKPEKTTPSPVIPELFFLYGVSPMLSFEVNAEPSRCGAAIGVSR